MQRTGAAGIVVVVRELPGRGSGSDRPHLSSAVTAALDYAPPAVPKPPNRLLGFPIGLICFLLSLYVAKEAIIDAHWMTHYPSWGCGFGYGALNRQFWALPAVQGIALAAWPICAKLRAGLSLCRVGVAVGALSWVGAYVWAL